MDGLEDYEIRPADEGWFSHDTGRFIPRYMTQKGQQVDTLRTEYGQGAGNVAYYQGQPVASVTWQETPDAYYIGSAYTQPEHRQKGLFNALTQDIRVSGRPVDAYRWENPWLKNKVRDWQRLGNILDPISPELSPYIFEDGGVPLPHMRPQVRRWIQETVYDELEKYHPKPEEWCSLVLTGSLTTFQLSDASDCDISVFVNPNFMPAWDRATLIGIAVHNLDGKTVMGTPYPLQVFIVSPKISKELLYQPGLRSGYDLDTDQWIVPPEPARAHDVEKEYNAWYVYALETIDKLKSLIKYNPTRAVEYWHYLHRRRREEEQQGKGDLGLFNIIFKMIVNKGLVGDLDRLTGEHTASKEAAWEDHFVNQINPIADAYDALPTYDPSAVPAWQELALDSQKRANELRNRYNISVTDDPEPYANAQEMFNDINKGNFVVSRANSEHPIWTPDQNVDFRIVHDMLGHHPSGGDFSWQGENQACGRHFNLLSPQAQQALMTECLGQTGAAIRNGGFGPQKVGLMSNLLAPAQQANNPYAQQTLSAKMPQGGFCHRHLRHGAYKLNNIYDWSEDPNIKESALPSHRLNWVPGTEGKGFVLTDGSVWTWPTQNMRPMHWQMDGRVKAMGQRHIPGSGFHIQPSGEIWQHGEGRSLNNDVRAMIRNADPNLNVDTDLLPPAPVQTDPFGHAQNLMWNTQPQTLAGVYDWEEEIR